MDNDHYGFTPTPHTRSIFLRSIVCPFDLVWQGHHKKCQQLRLVMFVRAITKTACFLVRLSLTGSTNYKYQLSKSIWFDRVTTKDTNLFDMVTKKLCQLSRWVCFDRVTTILVRFDRVPTKLLTFREVRDHVKKTCILSWTVQQRTWKRLEKKYISWKNSYTTETGKDTFWKAPE